MKDLVHSNHSVFPQTGFSHLFGKTFCKLVLFFNSIITCAGCLSAQVISYEIDPSFNTYDLFTKGAMYDCELRDQDIVISFDRSSGISNASEYCLIDHQGNLIENISPDHLGSIELYQEGALNWYGGGVGCGILPPHPEAGNGCVGYEFEFTKNIYGFPSFSSQSTGVLILDDETFLASGRYSTDSLNPGPEGVRHLVRIDSTGSPVEGFSMVQCEPWWAIMNTVLQTSEGKYVVSGEFTEINGIARNYIARLNSDFSVDTTFHSPFINDGGRAFISYQDSEDNLWVTCKYCTNTSNLTIEERSLIKLRPDGDIDSDFQIPEILTFYENGESFRLPPDEILEDCDGTFILAGTMMIYNDLEVNRLVKITPEGELIPDAFGVLGPDEADWGTWAVQHPAEASILALKKQEDGKLLIGGQFSSFGGEPYSCMVRLQPAGFIGTEDAYATTIGLKVWPNPAKEEIHLEASERISKVRVQDLTGKTLLEKSLAHEQNTLSLKDLPHGTYLFRCTTAHGIATEKVVITK
jgi:hypothetical protein